MDWNVNAITNEPDRLIRRLPFAVDEGIYLQSDAALLTGLSATTVRRWLQLERGETDITAIADQPIVSFLDLISLRAVASLRKAGMKLANIREGADYMRRDLGIDNPLAYEDLKTDGVNLYFRHSKGLLAVNAGGQLVAQEMVNAYLRDVRYAPLAGNRRLAVAWEPHGVSINPRVQRGAPCVSGTRIQVSVLQRFFEAGDTPAFLAEMYELEEHQVLEALNWFQRIKLKAA